MNTQTELTLSTGVVLKVHQVPPLVLARIYDQMPQEPKPPKFMNPDLGREEDNPSDPSYLDAMQKYQLKLTDMITNAVVALGTSLKSVPAGFPHPYKDFDAWAIPLNDAGITVEPQRHENDIAVYRSWVKYVAAQTQEDLDTLISSISRISGVAEEEVEKAAEMFRGEEERPVNS